MGPYHLDQRRFLETRGSASPRPAMTHGAALAATMLMVAAAIFVPSYKGSAWGCCPGCSHAPPCPRPRPPLLGLPMAPRGLQQLTLPPLPYAKFLGNWGALQTEWHSSVGWILPMGDRFCNNWPLISINTSPNIAIPSLLLLLHLELKNL